MPTVVGVRFKQAGKVYYFDPAGFELAVNDKVVVETTRGLELGEVSIASKTVDETEVVAPLKPVLRIATDSDLAQAEANKKKERSAFDLCIEKIRAHGLEMSLVDVEYTFDGSKIVFYFTADGRIDFRELVRDLAAALRTRIEMRQIGVRDEAKLLGGLGPCGRILCCTSFLGDFSPVSIRMAKDQNLSLNPTKISGLCGRLMCCLTYEADVYAEAKKDPSLGLGFQAPPPLDEEPWAVEEEEAEVEAEAPSPPAPPANPSRPRRRRHKRPQAPQGPVAEPVASSGGGRAGSGRRRRRS